MTSEGLGTTWSQSTVIVNQTNWIIEDWVLLKAKDVSFQFSIELFCLTMLSVHHYKDQLWDKDEEGKRFLILDTKILFLQLNLTKVNYASNGQ